MHVSALLQAVEEEKKRIVESEEGKESFCSVCTMLFSQFVMENMPSQIEAERKEVGACRGNDW